MADTISPTTPSEKTTGRTKGVGRIIVMLYAILALAAAWRSGFQILTKFDDAPVAFSLSAVSAVVYIIATFALAIPGRRAWKTAVVAVWFELIGVLVIGAWSLLVPDLFSESTVWSTFGIGYGFIPLILPVIGLYWLYKHRPAPLG
ncbi:hypothetical protein [Enteractinococcus coprophilus]|uniref:Integral membrane protein n=1 Tax=Enteractinococcus coprophilus TaxID=1027633 RepID=A0A543AK30_9MICC|nr:hypothetical protein [Enteractinococcus coprophilus]TQL72944.1 hypothetical protein FB556_1617 [Enteractinococcus coprophilus]